MPAACPSPTLRRKVHRRYRRRAPSPWWSVQPSGLMPGRPSTSPRALFRPWSAYLSFRSFRSRLSCLRCHPTGSRWSSPSRRWSSQSRSRSRWSSLTRSPSRRWSLRDRHRHPRRRGTSPLPTATPPGRRSPGRPARPCTSLPHRGRPLPSANLRRRSSRVSRPSCPGRSAVLRARQPARKRPLRVCVPAAVATFRFPPRRASAGAAASPRAESGYVRPDQGSAA